MTPRPDQPAEAGADDDTAADEAVDTPPASGLVAEPDPVDPAASPEEAAGQGAPAPAEPTEFSAEQIDALVAERDEFLDAYRRTAADFDNFRKQVQKRIVDEVARSQGGFVERMLPVLDAIDAARAHAAGDDGVEALAGALLGFLEKEGLERVDPADQAFDPNVAEAVVHEPGDHDHPMVTEVLRTGYLWQGRVIRPAMVKVAG